MSVERIPQGILHRNAARARFTLTRHRPAPALRDHVQYYWIVRWDLCGARPYEQRVLPNLSTHVVFSRDASGVWGPDRRVFRYVLDGAGQALGTRVHPGCCRSLLGRSAPELAGRAVPLDEVLGSAVVDAQEAVLAAGTEEEMAGVADDVLGEVVAPLSAPERSARAAVTRIAADPAITRVSELAHATGMSVRTLQRLFLDYVGTSPKWAIRIYRINDAAARIAADSEQHRSGQRHAELNQAALAAQLGYSDQAHFVRDFTTLVGTSPAAYRRQQNVFERSRI